MAKVTSKLQLTVPKVVAEKYGIRPGDELDFVPAGDVIRVIPQRRQQPRLRNDRLMLFDQATERQRRRQVARPPHKRPRDRGWKRHELYTRSRAR